MRCCRFCVLAARALLFAADHRPLRCSPILGDPGPSFPTVAARGSGGAASFSIAGDFASG
jgi:hypothetical protein